MNGTDQTAGAGCQATGRDSSGTDDKISSTAWLIFDLISIPPSLMDRDRELEIPSQSSRLIPREASSAAR